MSLAAHRADPARSIRTNILIGNLAFRQAVDPAREHRGRCRRLPRWSPTPRSAAWPAIARYDGGFARGELLREVAEQRRCPRHSAAAADEERPTLPKQLDATDNTNASVAPTTVRYGDRAMRIDARRREGRHLRHDAAQTKSGTTGSTTTRWRHSNPIPFYRAVTRSGSMDRRTPHRSYRRCCGKGRTGRIKHAVPTRSSARPLPLAGSVSCAVDRLSARWPHPALRLR